MDRHEKWEKVPVGYRYTKGEPFRPEGTRGEAKEGIIILKLGFAAGTEYQYFRDKTWFNAEVGTVITEFQDLKRLPEGTVLREPDNTLLMVGSEGVYTGYYDSSHHFPWRDAYRIKHHATIIYLPEKRGQ